MNAPLNPAASGAAAPREEGAAARRLSFILVFAPFALWIALVILVPQLNLFFLSLREKVGPQVYALGPRNYTELFGESVYVLTLVRTVVMSLLATFATLIIGFPIAYYIAKIARGRARTMLFMSCLLPFWVSELVRVFGWMLILRETGLLSRLLQGLGLVDGPVELLYNDVAVMVGLIYTSMLFMVVPLVSTLDSLDDALVEAGYDLGGNGFVVLWEIVIPHAKPGIVAGAIIVFMLNLGNYLTPTLLGGKNSQWFTAQIYSQFITRFNWESGSAFGFVLLVTSSLIVWLALRASGQTLSGTIGKG
ncbi:spermidine/putrescine transport system permease protein [Angulomicrobium tetraedrale]|uniref:Spermidine/putrescine transport system permease protein n=1 Tax=Ancylobacter tetraedralis TaxID=217068 RepID=A0A839ZDD7_9HYPH|nr:ABC transporter permease [Ancylobacter tetraedralis]MBB3772652.1 spermidine/putrescine transport system permease protein [Ancylobacter tetraedralis]